MASYKKGTDSREAILKASRQVLNEYGIGLTVEKMSNILQVTRGRITHFFRTREDLMVALMRDYEYTLGRTIIEFEWGQVLTFEKLYLIFDSILEIQYEYRCAISYVCIINRTQKEIHDHIAASYINRVDGIRLRLNVLVQQKLLMPRILEPEDFEIHCFQFTNLLTTWVVSQELYFSHRHFSEMKPRYIIACMSIYIPYLTAKGRKEFDAATAAYRLAAKAS